MDSFHKIEHCTLLALFSLICDDRNQNTCRNVSKISVNQSLKGFPTTFQVSDYESELAINTFYSVAKTLLVSNRRRLKDFVSLNCWNKHHKNKRYRTFVFGEL